MRAIYKRITRLEAMLITAESDGLTLAQWRHFYETGDDSALSDEWKALTAARMRQAEETLAMFSDDDDTQERDQGAGDGSVFPAICGRTGGAL